MRYYRFLRPICWIFGHRRHLIPQSHWPPDVKQLLGNYTKLFACPRCSKTSIVQIGPGKYRHLSLGGFMRQRGEHISSQLSGVNFLEIRTHYEKMRKPRVQKEKELGVQEHHSTTGRSKCNSKTESSKT